MEIMQDRILAEFIDAVKRSIEDNLKTGIEKYLLCGIPAGYNYNGRLTPEIFFKHFHVKPSELSSITDNEDVGYLYNKATAELLESLANPKENLVILQGPAGSGKSTFVSGFPNIINDVAAMKKERPSVQTIRIDCASDTSRYHDTSMQFPMRLLINEYADFYSAMQGNEGWWKQYDRLLDELCHVDPAYTGASRGYAGAFVDFIRSGKISCAEKSLAWMRHIPDKNLEYQERQHAVSLFILMLACKIAAENDAQKYIIFFDNLEMYIYHTDQPINGYAYITENLRTLFSELQAICRCADSEVFTQKGCMTHFTIALCLRTTTRSDVNYLHTDGIPNHREDETARVIDLPTFDFAPVALQKKLEFLQEQEALTQYYDSVQEYVKSLYDIEPHEPIDDDLATFSARYYIPFNNCNYRIAMLNLGEVSKYGEDLAYLDQLLRQCRVLPHIKAYGINGKRMFALRSRYEYLRCKGYLQPLGIEDFKPSSEHMQSDARKILNYIFYREGISGRRVNFFDIKQHIQLDQKKLFEDAADAIIALGPVSCNRIREEALRKWGALVNISGINAAQDIGQTLKMAMKDDKLAKEIILELTPAGKDYVLNESKQFEYFLFRITDDDGNSRFKPLFSYLSVEDVDTAVEAISEVYAVILDYVKKFDVDCPKKLCYDLRHCTNCYADDPVLCMTMLRAFDLFSIFKLIVDYIDRYRCVLIASLLQNVNRGYELSAVKRANEKLLKYLTKFIGLYDIMEECLNTHEFNGKTLYKYLLQITGAVVDATRYHIIWPYYYSLYLPQNKENKCYPFKSGSANFIRVVEIAKRIDADLSAQGPTTRIFEIMDRVYSDVAE